MAQIVAQAQEESILAGSLKPKHILIEEDGGRREYVRVNTVSKVKCGKHGSAKVIVNGKYLKSKRTANLSFVASQNVLVAALTKKQYVIEDIFESNESFYMRPNDSSGAPSEEYPYNQIDEEFVKQVMEAFEKNNNEELAVTFVYAPGYLVIDDIRPLKQ